jgi:hypothetical protein
MTFIAVVRLLICSYAAEHLSPQKLLVIGILLPFYDTYCNVPYRSGTLACRICMAQKKP